VKQSCSRDVECPEIARLTYVGQASSLRSSQRLYNDIHPEIARLTDAGQARLTDAFYRSASTVLMPH